MPSPPNILVCPLDWGLGHATRMVPVIEALLQRGARVVIAADKRPLAFLQGRFPQLEFVRLPGYEPVYPENGSMAWRLLRDFPKMKRLARRAHHRLQELVKSYAIDTVISDNRYEMYAPGVRSVFVTHQLQVRTEGWQQLAAPFIRKTIRSYLKHYDEVWVPDLPGDGNLAGALSHPSRLPHPRVRYIGWLSRFAGPEVLPHREETDLLVLVSGPEPQRTLFEEMLVKQALACGKQTVVLQGKPEERERKQEGNVVLIPHLPDAELAALLASAKTVVSRPGYSTLMDLTVFGKRAIFVPTPGQTEQEYLARRLTESGMAFSMPQKYFNLEEALKQSERFSGLPRATGAKLLDQAVSSLTG